MKLFFTSCFLIILSSCFGQNDFVFIGKITDATTKLPIAECYVQLNGMPIATNSDENGRFKLRAALDIDTIQISFTKFNYEPYTQNIILSQSSNTHTIELNVILHQGSYMLDEINVSGSPDTVWGSTELNVADFAFIQDNLLLLTYDHEERWKKQEESKKTLFQSPVLILLDKNKQEVTRCAVPEVAIGFYVDYLQEIFIQCRYSTYYISIADNHITLQKVDMEKFNKAIKPVIDTTGNLTVFSNYNADYPAFEYMIFDNKDSICKTFRYMIDEKMMEMFRSEYKYLDTRGKLEAFTFEVNTGIDKEVIAAYMNGFQNTYYYEPLNTPLVVSNDTLIIFDHHHDKMLRYDWSGQPIDSALINYHKASRPDKWGEKILKDRTTEKVYTTYLRNGFTHLRNIDVYNGNAGDPIKLIHRYIDHVRLSNGYAYYVYRPFESSQKRFLYKIKLSI